MLVLIKIMVAVYVVAINVYSFLLVKARHSDESEGKCPSGDGKLFLAGALGGAAAIYVSMFVFKYRLSSLVLMVSMPVLIAINAYILILLVTNDFGFAVAAAYSLISLSLR